MGKLFRHSCYCPGCVERREEDKEERAGVTAHSNHGTHTIPRAADLEKPPKQGPDGQKVDGHE